MESLGYWLIVWVVVSCFFFFFHFGWFFKHSGYASWNVVCTSVKVPLDGSLIFKLIFPPENDIFIVIFWAGLSFTASHVFFFLVFQGITFDEFRSFFQFLNNLEDFAIAMQMYNFAARSIGQGRKRAVVAGATNTEGVCLHTHTNDVFVLQVWCATSRRNDPWCEMIKNCFYSLSYQMSLREQCMWPLGWSWHVTLWTPFSRSLM